MWFAYRPSLYLGQEAVQLTRKGEKQMFVVRVKLHDDNELLAVRCCNYDIDDSTDKLTMTDQNADVIGEFDRDCIQYWCATEEAEGARDANIA
jgi:hypothetical protein